MHLSVRSLRSSEGPQREQKLLAHLSGQSSKALGCGKGPPEARENSSCSLTFLGRATKPSAAVNSSSPACVMHPPGVESSNSMAPLRGAPWAISEEPTEAGRRSCAWGEECRRGLRGAPWAISEEPTDAGSSSCAEGEGAVQEGIGLQVRMYCLGLH